MKRARGGRAPIFVDDASRSKPSPDIFHAALKLLRHPRRDTVLVVGDSPVDALAVKKAKIASIGLLCGGFPKQVLKNKRLPRRL